MPTPPGLEGDMDDEERAVQADKTGCRPKEGWQTLGEVADG
jgi:hypothetical protein